MIEDVRYWALLVQIVNEKSRDHSYCIAITERVILYFIDEDHQERVRGLLETLKTPGSNV